MGGVQIDLLIDRPDRVVNLCEFKYYEEEIMLNREQQESLLKRKASFKIFSKSKKQLYWTLITLNGFNHNQFSLGTIDQHLSAEIFFEEASLNF